MYASLLLLSATGFAGTPIDLPQTYSVEANRAGDSGVTVRPFTQEVNLRGGWATIPASIFDIWYFDEEDNGGLHEERPRAHAYAIGLEYVIRTDQANGIFYFEYMPSLMDAGYWDDREDPPEYDDGDYVVPNRLSLFNIGANYAFEVKIQPWVSLLFGGGLGVGIRGGSLDKWDRGLYSSATENYEANPDTPDDSYDIPKVLPVVDIQAGVRFVISEQANIRFYGGLHNLIFVGSSVGVVF